MLLHLGGCVAVNAARILAVLDIATAVGNRSSRRALNQARALGLVDECEGATAKAVVLLAAPGGKARWVFTPISSATLRQRLKQQSVLTYFEQ